MPDVRSATRVRRRGLFGGAFEAAGQDFYDFIKDNEVIASLAGEIVGRAEESLRPQAPHSRAPQGWQLSRCSDELERMSAECGDNAWR